MAFIKTDGKWVQLGTPRRFPYWGLGVELKTYSSGKAPAVARFDNFRIYPRPASHFVCFELISEGGGVVSAANISVKLCESDGKRLAASANVFAGRCLLPLKKARWKSYPASAIVRVYQNGRQIGKDQKIEAKDVDGLYPGDVWRIVLR